MRGSNFYTAFSGESETYYKGERMTVAEARKRKAADERAEKNKKRKKRNATCIQLIAARVDDINNSFRLAKSYRAYFRNGYRQWGTIARDIIHDEHIEPHFVSFVEAFGKASEAAKQIEKIAKKSDKDIFGFIEKLAYAMDDMLTSINRIADGCVNAQIYVNPRFKDAECVYGSEDGKRLGIKQLNSRIAESVTIASKGIHELLRIVDEGVDAMEYDANSPRTITFVQG